MVTQLQKYTPFVHTWLITEEWKKLDAVCISNEGSDIDWIEQYQTVKARVCFQVLLSKKLRSSSQLHKIQTGVWPGEVLHVAKTKTIRKRELNISDIFLIIFNFILSQNRRFLCKPMS